MTRSPGIWWRTAARIRQSWRVMPPRIPPKNVEDLDPETQELVTKTLTSPDGEVLNIFRTMSHHPWVTKRFMQLGTQLLVRGSLPARERELLILRTGWN